MTKQTFNEDYQRKLAEAEQWAKMDALGGQLDLMYETLEGIEFAMSRTPDRETMKAKGAELVKIAKDVRRQIKNF